MLTKTAFAIIITI